MDKFKRMLRYLRPYWWRIVLSMIASSAVGGLDGAIAYYVKPMLDTIFTEKKVEVLALLPFAVIALFMVKNACRITNDYFIRTASQLGIQDLRNELYSKQLSLSMSYFNRNSTGHLMGKILNDVGAMQESVAGLVVGLFRDGVSLVSLLCVVFYRDWQLAIITFIIIPLTAIPAQKIGRKMKRVAQKGLEQAGTLTSVMQETFSGIKVVKAFGLEQRESERFKDENRKLYLFTRKSIKYDSIASPITEAITSTGIAAVVWVGGQSVMSGKMSPSALFSFITAMIMLYSPVKRLLNSYNAVQRSFGAAERIFDVLDIEPEIKELDNPVKLTERAKGVVEYRNVSFKYKDEYVLRDVSFTGNDREVVAFVGPSGGGKTTLVSLIPRFYDVTDGSILIDGVDIRHLEMASLINQIALVDQETILFNDTIRNNICYGRSDATEDEIQAAARAGYAHDFIMELPEGYETNIGDRGIRLSGGQRQRICIARALLKNAPILILDEATSALDTESEQMVQQALDNLMLNRTTFVIAHRLSTILHADKIVVIEKGRIVETGRHDQLLEKGGLYSRLYNMQFKDSESVLT